MIRSILQKLSRGIASQDAWGEPSFSGDGLRTWGKNMAWMHEPSFRAAYDRGFHSGHRFTENDPDLRLEWRVHIMLWAAQQALQHEGDFVECGVNTGIFSLAICQHLDFQRLPRKFYLFDTFCGIPESQMSTRERPTMLPHNVASYRECYEQVRASFKPWPNAVLVRGMVPETLSTVDIPRVAFLSIDMNIALPERAALEHFWPRLSSGAPVILDDYGWAGFEEQKDSADDFARRAGVTICCLPTGQGLLIKP